MLIKPTMERLRAMRLGSMAEAFSRQVEDPNISQLCFEERFSLLVDHQWLTRQNRALERRFTLARLAHRASLEDIDYKHPRGLDRTQQRAQGCGASTGAGRARAARRALPCRRAARQQHAATGGCTAVRARPFGPRR